MGVRGEKEADTKYTVYSLSTQTVGLYACYASRCTFYLLVAEEEALWTCFHLLAIVHWTLKHRWQ